MRKTIYVLSLLILVLGTWLVVLWIPSFTSQEDDRQETRYGLNEGLELVEQDYGKDGKRYVVEDADGKELFVIPPTQLSARHSLSQRTVTISGTSLASRGFH